MAVQPSAAPTWMETSPEATFGGRRCSTLTKSLPGRYALHFFITLDSTPGSSAIPARSCSVGTAGACGIKSPRNGKPSADQRNLLCRGVRCRSQCAKTGARCTLPALLRAAGGPGMPTSPAGISTWCWTARGMPRTKWPLRALLS